MDELSGTATNPGLIEAPRARCDHGWESGRSAGLYRQQHFGCAQRPDRSSRQTITPSFRWSWEHRTSILRPPGTVTLGENQRHPDSPELSSTETVVGTQLALPSQVNIQGEAIHLANNALLVAPNAAVSPERRNLAHLSVRVPLHGLRRSDLSRLQRNHRCLRLARRDRVSYR